MTSNRELAESYLEDAEYSLEEAKEAYKRELYHRVVRRCQECVELSLKATLRLLGIEYPKTHEVSGALIKIAGKLPNWFRRELDEVINISTALAIQRALHSMETSCINSHPRRSIEERTLKKL